MYTKLLITVTSIKDRMVKDKYAYPSILDFYHNTKALQHIRTASSKISINKLQVTRDSSEDEGSEVHTMDYYEWSSDNAKKEKAQLSEKVTVVDLTAMASRTMRKRKTPPPKSSTSKAQINRTFPIPTPPKVSTTGTSKRLLGRN
jgi:hypothetical protein